MTTPAPTARRLSLWLPVAAWAAVLFALSSMPALPPLPPRLTDKVMHASAYAVLAATFIRAFAGGRWTGVTARVLIWAVVATTLYGVTDEFHQWFVPGRTVDSADVAADFTGAVTAAVVGLGFGWARQRRATGGPR